MEIIISEEIGKRTTEKFEALYGNVTVRLNSPGGDVFEALTIYNRLKNYVGGTVEIVVEGLCASAATVIACAGKCISYENALFMIHNPMLELDGYYPSTELTRRLEMLTAIEGELIKVYVGKTGKSEEEIRAALSEETWLTAEEALAWGLVDEIIPSRATVENKGDVVIINHLAVSTGRYKNKRELLKMGAMSNATLLEKITAFFGRSDREEELKAEIARLKAENEVLRSEIKTTDMIYALIEDNVKSGASRVKASTSEAEESRRTAVTKVVEMANRRNGR